MLKQGVNFSWSYNINFLLSKVFNAVTQSHPFLGRFGQCLHIYVPWDSNQIALHKQHENIMTEVSQL